MIRCVLNKLSQWNPLLDSSNVEIKGRHARVILIRQSLTPPSDWVRIAEEIELNYQNFDSFVVLHGTDTMAYSSSALSFLLEDLGKTVVSVEGEIDRSALTNSRYRLSLVLRFRYPSFAMTRSKIYCGRCRSLDNMLSQVPIRPSWWSELLNELFLECTLFFNHALYRGNRVVKASTSELAAFNSPNLPPLATGM